MQHEYPIKTKEQRSMRWSNVREPVRARGQLHGYEYSHIKQWQECLKKKNAKKAKYILREEETDEGGKGRGQREEEYRNTDNIYTKIVWKVLVIHTCCATSA